MRKAYSVLAGLVMTLASGLAQAQPAYRLTDLGHLGGGYVTGADLNDAGQVTGWSETADSETHAFLWDDTADPKMTDLHDGSWGATNSFGEALNSAGQVTGSYSLPGDHAFLWNGSTMVDLGALEPAGGTASYGNAINDAGLVTGYF